MAATVASPYGTNSSGGKTPPLCWRSIALNGRTAYIAFDSDSATNYVVLW